MISSFAGKSFELGAEQSHFKSLRCSGSLEFVLRRLSVFKVILFSFKRLFMMSPFRCRNVTSQGSVDVSHTPTSPSGEPEVRTGSVLWVTAPPSGSTQLLQEETVCDRRCVVNDPMSYTAKDYPSSIDSQV